MHKRIIVGGGLVGVELPGEITERYSEKKSNYYPLLRLVHEEKQRKKSRKFVKDFLKKRG